MKRKKEKKEKKKRKEKSSLSRTSRQLAPLDISDKKAYNVVRG
jgi:hypothetical protein